LYDICRWTGLDTGLRDISLRVASTNNDNPGLFLKLDATDWGNFQPFARIGKDGTRTAFDILPGYSSPQPDIPPKLPPPTYYVIAHLPDPVSSDAVVFLELGPPDESLCVLGKEVCTERALVYFEFEKKPKQLQPRGKKPLTSTASSTNVKIEVKKEEELVVERYVDTETNISWPLAVASSLLI
jgi:hypothetical protein